MKPSALIAAAMLCAHTLAAQQADPPGGRNGFIREVAAEAARHIPEPRVALIVAGEEKAPFVAQIFSEVLLAAGKQVLTRGDAGASRLRIETAESEKYTASQSDSLYLRNWSVRLGLTVESGDGARVLWAREFERSFADTVRKAERNTERAQGGGRDEGWFSALLEPLLVAATTAVIVILLFTVRGS